MGIGPNLDQVNALAADIRRLLAQGSVTVKVGETTVQVEQDPETKAVKIVVSPFDCTVEATK